MSKKYWLSLEEKDAPATQWDQPEFEQSVNEMASESKGVSRRTFFQFMGAGAVMVGAACRRPAEQIVPAVIQAPEYTPGIAQQYASVAPDGSGIVVRTREGRPVKIAGNPDHPLSLGGLTANTVADLMDLYDPDRLRKPVQMVKLKSGKRRKKVGSEGAITADINNKLGEGDYVLLTGPVDSPSTRKLIASFLNRFPGGRHVSFRPDPTLRQIAAGQAASYGNTTVPNYRFDRADYVLALEADFLGTMIAPAYFGAQFGLKRDLNNGKFVNTLAAIESMFTVTGSNADFRVPVRPGDQVAAGLVLLGKVQAKLGQGVINAPATATDLGLDEKILDQIATDLVANRGKGLVIAGSPLASSGSNSATQLQQIANTLNSILGNDGVTVDAGQPIVLDRGASDADITGLIADMNGGQVKTLIIAGANPVYHLPAASKVADAIAKVPNVYGLSDRLDETSSLAGSVLPVSHYLESWGDKELVSGVIGLQQPVIRPLWHTLSFEDRLIAIAGGSLGGASRFYDYLQSEWAGRGNWTSILQKGSVGGLSGGTGGGRNAGGNGALADYKLPAAGLNLGLYYNASVVDGSGANNSYRQELPDPVTKGTWTNYICLLPETARKLKLKQGSIASVTTDAGKVELPVLLQPGLHPDAALIALGYGRTAAGKVADGRGANGLDLVAGGAEIKLAGVSATVAATGDHEEIGNTQTVYRDGFNTEDRAPFAPEGFPDAPYKGSSQTAFGLERPIILETTLKEWEQDPSKHTPAKIEYPGDKGKKDPSIMQAFDYSKHPRWHMAIDLTQCTGCGACVTSCNIENNIPMVGPEEVARGREMHWLRIDRYYSGDESNPEVAHQPMLCQHCENAPCENVCPVAATTHTSEGLNTMTYNRCIGTRYCANNCPYKVRRFNYFENWSWLEGAERKITGAQHLGLNPDVTVRTRGVMEKCSFCVQRISTARQDARKNKTRIKDGAVVTACQEVCPSDAISFGDLNDESSEVAKRAKDPRGYKVLDFLGVNPSVTYLTKVRNKG